MNIQEAKAAVERVDGSLSAQPYVVAHSFERNGRRLHLALADRLREACKKGRVWKSLVPVRLVSHHLRLLGVLSRGATEDALVLVDFDNS